jgi:hypothetical protein
MSMSRKPAYHPLRGKKRMNDPVGQVEIAERAGVKPVTVKKWRERHPSFPQPRWTVGGNPAWEWEDVLKWLRDNGRTPHLVRWRAESSASISVIEEHLDVDDNWTPTAVFVDLGSGPGNELWKACPQASLLETVGGDKRKAQDVADFHLMAWLDAKQRWVAQHPDEEMPEHLAGSWYPSSRGS